MFLRDSRDPGKTVHRSTFVQKLAERIPGNLVPDRAGYFGPAVISGSGTISRLVTWHPYGVAPEYKFSVPGGMGPAPEPYHFWGRTQCRSEFVKIRIGGYDNETACLSKIPDFAIRTLQ
jgi:hypothetical protein